ncbi:MAG: TRAP transporter substrate-binding protein [Rhodospirillales bacterium]|nr:TRAP transporter substrate-binding protein [Rhodospirillales bacterium]
MKFTRTVASVLTGGAVMAIAAAASAQTKIKFATYVPPQHAVSKYLEKNLRDAAANSGGAFTINYFPGAQLGPPPKYYGMALSGQAEITWFLHGNTPGVFPLSELGTVPLLFASGELATKVLNEPAMRKALSAEHKGMHILDLHAHQPGNVFMGKKPIRTLADFRGKRLRVPSGPVRSMAIALGATPDGMPPTQWAEALQKGTIDGVFTDYGGAGLAFRIGPVTKYATELYFYVGTFCVCMNQKAYDGLPAKARNALTAAFARDPGGTGKSFDFIDGIGKKRMMSEGTEPISFSAADMAKFRSIAKNIAGEAIAKAEKKGLPGATVYALMQSLGAKHAKSSKSFWK